MTYAFLLYPHANIRYRQSLLQLAVQELSMTLSALGREAEVVPQKMGGAMFLTFEAAKLTERDMRMLSQLASVYMLFEMEDGKLTTLERTHPNYVGEDLPALLKYKGKTNEMFTDTMLTMALAASTFMPVHDSQLVVCDPMAGRGTTLMLALRRGYHGVGIEIGKADVKEAADYMTRYLEFHRIKYKRTDSALTVRGQVGGRENKFVFSDSAEHFKDGDTRTLRLICGDTREAEALLKPNSVHLMVTDAPYGVQKGTAGRQDSIGGTIAAALPGWFDVLKSGGVLAMSFNTHVTRREGLVRLFEKAGFEIVQTANLEHWVEQAISRDVILARKP
ncbi:MAG: TRM11 family SAM-dependent methyltransferase [Christensenellales bacterium]